MAPSSLPKLRSRGARPSSCIKVKIFRSLLLLSLLEGILWSLCLFHSASACGVAYYERETVRLASPAAAAAAAARGSDSAAAGAEGEAAPPRRTAKAAAAKPLPSLAPPPHPLGARLRRRSRGAGGRAPETLNRICRQVLMRAGRGAQVNLKSTTASRLLPPPPSQALETRALLLALRVRAGFKRRPCRALPADAPARAQDEARARQRTLENSALLPASREQIAQLTNLRAFLPVRARPVGGWRATATGGRPHARASVARSDARTRRARAVAGRALRRLGL